MRPEASGIFHRRPKSFSLKKYKGIFIGFFKKALKHIHCQSFSESSRPCKQNDRNAVINQIPNQKGFINIVTVFDYIRIRCTPNRTGKLPFIFPFRRHITTICQHGFLRYFPITPIFPSAFKCLLIAQSYNSSVG